MNSEFLMALYETFIMVFISTIVSVVFGFIMGSILFLNNEKGQYPNKILYTFTNFFVNLVRSFPYLIFVIVLIPITRFVIGTAFGVYAASFPICFVGSCLLARFVEQSFYGVNEHVIYLAKTLNANKFQLVVYFLIKESQHTLVLGLTSTIISIISYSTVMGIVGGGGIGDYAIRYGYYEYNYYVIYKSVIVMIIFVYFIQFIGNRLAIFLDKRR